MDEHGARGVLDGAGSAGRQAVVISFQPACTASCPASPYNWAPVVDGAWLLLGILVLVYYRSRGQDEWVSNAGLALGEAEEQKERVVGSP
jgi:hypothetical protein